MDPAHDVHGRLLYSDDLDGAYGLKIVEAGVLGLGAVHFFSTVVSATTGHAQFWHFRFGISCFHACPREQRKSAVVRLGSWLWKTPSSS
jgi:hypothetical protein